MLLHMQIFGDLNPDADMAAWGQPLQNAFDDFTSWRKNHKISCSQKKFKYRMLHRDGYGFFLNCKGFNARVVCEWLRSLLQKIKLAPPFGVILDDRMDLCEVAMMLAIIMAIILVSFMCS
jgi:hypothetical protein